jgi:hypothetical protein
MMAAVHFLAYKNPMAEQFFTNSVTAMEQAKRQRAFDYARGSLRLEGFIMSPHTERQFERYIRGEITREERDAEIRRGCQHQ